ncbi:MAG TPA: ABC transporter permease [Amycolatopsis sp.]|nr:ABC transporter permease [Amycolatopsis sp.]
MTLPRRPGLLLAVLTVLALAVCVLMPDVVAPHPPDAIDPAAILRPPGAGHLFGTDQLGRDLFSRVVHSARAALLVAVGAIALSLAGGAVVGLASGFAGGWLDGLFMRAADVLLTFPPLLLALGVVAVLGSSATNVAVAVGFANLAPFARLVRAQVLHLRGRPYVHAATLSGVSPPAILFRHIVPNAAEPVVVVALVSLGAAMLASSSLSFLGFGPRPPATDWGTLAAAGRDYLGSAWWLTTFPSLAVVVTVLAATTFARALRKGRS